MKKIFGQISKSIENENGTLTVVGIASTQNVDSDGETILASAMNEAIPSYMKFGAVREMHENSAVGTALNIYVNENNETIIEALIIDDDAIKKVKYGVYKAFQIGGSVIERDQINKKIITKLNLNEVSLVDVPANSDAIIQTFKLFKEKEENMKIEQKIEKSLYDVNRISQILSDLKDLQNYIEYEKQFEQDDSKIPDDLKVVIASLATILVNTVNEEVSELIDNKKDENNEEVLTQEDQNDTIEMSKESGDLSKSMSDQNKNIDIDSIMKSIDLKFESKNKEIEEIKKQLTQKDETIESLSKRIKIFEEMPKPFKHELIDLKKQNDTNSVQNQDHLNVYVNGKIDEVASAIKKAHASKRI